MKKFRVTMFKRLIPNLEYIGLLTPRVQHLYEAGGPHDVAGGKSAAELTARDLLDELS